MLNSQEKIREVVEVEIVEDSREVTKHNALIEAHYKLTLLEQRIILNMIALIEPTDEKFKTYRLKIREVFGIEGGKDYQELIDASGRLVSKLINIKKPNDGLLQITFLSSAEYIPEDGVIELEFSPKMQPYLLQLKNNFTSYKLHRVMSFRKVNTIRLYELMKQYENTREKTRTLTIDELQNILGTKYTTFADIKKSVLDPSKNEMHEKSDIFFTYEPVKKGRKIVAIKFTILADNSDKKDKDFWKFVYEIKNRHGAGSCVGRYENQYIKIDKKQRLYVEVFGNVFELDKDKAEKFWRYLYQEHQKEQKLIK
jgi:plasmid replication initiation protein